MAGCTIGCHFLVCSFVGCFPPVVQKLAYNCIHSRRGLDVASRQRYFVSCLTHQEYIDFARLFVGGVCNPQVAGYSFQCRGCSELQSFAKWLYASSGNLFKKACRILIETLVTANSSKKFPRLSDKSFVLRPSNSLCESSH